MKRGAFTLVELLVVIAIVGLLSTVAVVAFNSSKLQARNAKRNADIKQLITAFDLGYSANNDYPSVGDGTCVSTSCYGTWQSYDTPNRDAATDDFIQPYINKPTDPTDNGARGLGGYIYKSTGTGGSCQCVGTGPGGAPLTVGCGDNACGSDYNIYQCSAGGWSWTGLPCTGPFPVGHVLFYALEVPGTCGTGRVYYSSANYIQCMVSLD